MKTLKSSLILIRNRSYKECNWTSKICP